MQTTHHPQPDQLIYTENGNLEFTHKSKSKIKFSDLTSLIEGKDLGEMRKIWQETAISELRLNLMSNLKDKNVGFREVENFGLGLKYSFKSQKFIDQNNKPIKGVVQEAMKVKLVDERHHYRELNAQKYIKKKRLGEKHHPKSHSYKRIINFLRQEAAETKAEQGRKLREKAIHLEKVYREAPDEELGAPPDMSAYQHLSIFSDSKYQSIQVDEIKVPRIGDVILSAQEESFLKRSPKFALPQALQEDSLREEMERAYSLVRMELQDEDETEKEVEVRNIETNLSGSKERKEEKEAEERRQAQKEDSARTRQVFDPITNEFDERKRRATDLVECARVTLPRPLSTVREAETEMMREIHERIYQEYRAEHCSVKGDQESNLTEQERKGMISLMGRIKKENLIVMRTDKSGKLCVTSEDKYKEMGKVHVEGDIPIGREKIRETDKVMNEHSSAGCGIWSTGSGHQHEDRIIQSKTSRSENRAKLYLSFKDHKKEQEKTRPIGTANSSNTRAFANSVSDLLESVANSEQRKFEVISTEDLLHSTKNSNKQVEERKKKVEDAWIRKAMCRKERNWKERRCLNCVERRKGRKLGDKIPGEDPDNEQERRSVAEDILEELVEETLEMLSDLEEIRNCKDCTEEIRKAAERDCEECGKGEKAGVYALVGMDAVALFPSLTGKRTAHIVQKRTAESDIKLRGFNWKRAAIYIKINRHLVRNIKKEIRKYIPIRKSDRGTTPGMSSQGLKSKAGNEDLQWIFIGKKPTEQEEKELASLVVEIAIRILWENYCYDFGGQTYLQKEGGPIGQRPTMAASRIVMQEFFLQYERVLLKAGLEITLLKVYVDDGRQLTSLLEKGMRYVKEKEEYSWSQEAEEEDLELEKKGESRAAFMARLCLPLMNDINPDLTFTAEVADDFEDQKLPTLDTKLWMRQDGTLVHSYFEKEMRTQILLEKDSAMSVRQKFCILGNELTRRLYNLDQNMGDRDLESEVDEVIEHFTKQCKNSGWERKDTREIVLSGFRGWQRRVKRRREDCGAEYRSAARSLPARARKKLTGREDWYRQKRDRETDDEEEYKPQYRGMKKKRKKVTLEKDMQSSNNIAVMFVPFTARGELARRLRDAEAQLERQTGYRIKIVERTGTKIEDLLHRSNPWQGQDCKREKCLLCMTKVRTGKFQEQDCTKRCIVYETWCISCEEKEIEKLENEEEDENTKKEKKKKIKKYKYIGETSRSVYERGLEHLRDCEELKKDSHMVKHYFDQHEGEEIEKMEFGMKVLKACRSAFTRQISESVQIQTNKKNHLILNSRSEYNRCALPRLTAKLGDQTWDKIEKIKRQEKLEELELERKIRNMKVKNSKDRREVLGRQDQPAPKKRRTGDQTYKRVLYEEKNPEKRKEPDSMETKEIRRVYDIFKTSKKLRKAEEPEIMEKSKAQIDWELRLKEREERMAREERERNSRIEKAQKLERSFHLLRLCRETIKEYGDTWEKSKERRDKERDEEERKHERLELAKIKKAGTIDRLETKKMQIKITSTLATLPGNRKKLLEMEMRRERRLDLQEAKLQLWKKWRKSKGKRSLHPKLGKENIREDLSRKLERIETEVKKYEKELADLKRENQKKLDRVEKKRKKEAHWAMMKWVTIFITENQEDWDLVKAQKTVEKEEEERE